MAWTSQLRFGIRGKIALLVVVAAALAAYLVARLLGRSAEELLRSHELVDLGDEAQLRGWEIADQVDGLREDTLALAYSTEFQAALMSGGSERELKALAEAVCRRYWSRYLSVEIVSEDGDRIRSIEAKGAPAEASRTWMPEPPALQRATGQRTFILSEIQRLLIRRRDAATGIEIERWEPVIWACASLPRTDVAGKEPAPLLRMMMSLHAPASPRHLFALIGPRGEWLVRPEEHAGEGRPINDGLIQAIARDDEVREGLLPWRQRSRPASSGEWIREEPRVERIKLFEYQPLQAPYWFLEGLPGEGLRRAFEEVPEVEMGAVFDAIRANAEAVGRVGGVGGGGRELRLLAPDRERLDRLRDAVSRGLEDRFGAAAGGLSWRRPVICDEAHAWAIRLGMDTVEDQPGYLIVYAVLDDELASSIQQEMDSLRRFAFVIALLAGIIAFMISLFFVRPLQRMTLTAQRVSEADPERLPTQLRRLVDHLPVGRGDEVGDIARASKRLFEEVLESQAQLENRVRERTAKLARANLELERANEQLTSLSREKDAFVAKVSHDLRQPLNAIFLQVEALKLSRLDDQQTRDVGRIEDHALRELNLVNDILEYQKIIMGAETLRRDRIDVDRLLRELEEAHGPVARRKGLAFAVEAGEPGLILEADRRRVRQILDNLLANACKFTAAGSVAVSARSLAGDDGGAWIEFAVADTGRGMEAEEQAKAFVPFVSNKKGNEGGTGLGLSICRELCHQMGGRIVFVSQPGAGTRFTVSLPAAATGDRYDGGEPPPSGIPAPTD